MRINVESVQLLLCILLAVFTGPLGHGSRDQPPLGVRSYWIHHQASCGKGREGTQRHGSVRPRNVSGPCDGEGCCNGGRQGPSPSVW